MTDSAAGRARTSVARPVRYTFEWYEQFLDGIADRGYEFGRYGDAIEPGTVLLRHDVDLSPRRALRTARIEHERGIEATYFVLVSSPMYNVFDAETRRLLEAIESLGHDVGLHFSTHQYWAPGNLPADDAIADRVATERDTLAGVVDPVETVSFHIPPDGVLRQEFAAFPSTYEPRFFTEIGYRGDSSQRWRDDPPAVAAFGDRVQVLTHPGLWGETDRGFHERVHRSVDRTAARTSEYAHERYVAERFG